MILKIEQDAAYTETEITVRCAQVDDRLEKLLAQIRLYGFTLPASADGREYRLAPEDILYCESLEDKTLVYTCTASYTSPCRLYELEQLLRGACFARISKSVVLNIAWVNSVRSLLDGRIEVLLKNGEKAVVNRHYAQSFRERFDLDGRTVP